MLFCLKRPMFTEEAGSPPTIMKKSRATHCAPSTLARKELRSTAPLLLRPNAMTSPSPSSLACRRRWRRFPRPRCSVEAGPREMARADLPVAEEKAQGPRVGGVEDWKDAPTMAMLTTPVAREKEPPGEGEALRRGRFSRQYLKVFFCCCRCCSFL